MSDIGQIVTGKLDEHKKFSQNSTEETKVTLKKKVSQKCNKKGLPKRMGQICK